MAGTRSQPSAAVVNGRQRAARRASSAAVRNEGCGACEEDAGPVIVYGVSASVVYGLILLDNHIVLTVGNAYMHSVERMDPFPT